MCNCGWALVAAGGDSREMFFALSWALIGIGPAANKPVPPVMAAARMNRRRELTCADVPVLVSKPFFICICVVPRFRELCTLYSHLVKLSYSNPRRMI